MEKTSETLTTWLLEHYGLPGVIIIGLVVWLVLKDRQYQKLLVELREARDAHLEDAKASTELLLQVQSGTGEAVRDLRIMFDAVKGRGR